jgi:hypothetical protein
MMGAAISAAITTHLGMSSPNIVQSSFDGLRVRGAASAIAEVASNRDCHEMVAARL